MTRYTTIFTTVLAVTATTTSLAQAVVNLELSSPDDLLDLSVGQTATVEMSLTGLDTAAGEQLVSLAGSVLFPSSILGTPANITAGPIIPDPLSDPFDFQVFDAPGQADATFLTFNVDATEHITDNGVFFTFEVTSGSVGSGVFTFDALALQAEQFDPNDPLFPILVDVDPGADLPFVVTAPDGGAVPEPLTAGLAAMGLAGLGVAVTRRHR